MVRTREHRTVEDISTAISLEASMIWHDDNLHHEQYTGEYSAMLLPMIDLDASDPSGIYTTMQFVSAQAKLYYVILNLTFDQPLYWNALTNVQSQTDGSDLKHMVIRL